MLEYSTSGRTAGGVHVFETTDRMLGRPGRIADVTWSDLKTVRVNGVAVVPRLDELLDTWGDRYLNIDMKADAVVTPTVDAVQRTRAAERVLLASFNDARLDRARRIAGPAVATSLGARRATALWVASRIGRGGGRPARIAVAAQMPIRAGRTPVVDARFLAYAHRLGLAVHVWTVDDPDDMRGLLDAGVDGIMTDHIDVLRDVYTERGLWPA